MVPMAKLRDGRNVVGMAEEAAGSQEGAIASKGTDEIGFIRQVLGDAGSCLVICVDGKGQLFVQFCSGLRTEYDVDGGVRGGDVLGKLDDGLGDVGRALLLGDEDIARW